MQFSLQGTYTEATQCIYIVPRLGIKSAYMKYVYGVQETSKITLGCSGSCVGWLVEVTLSAAEFEV